MRLENKVALITGARGGIGAAVARRFAREGAVVGAADIDGEAARRVASEIVAQGGEALGLTLDVTNTDSWNAAVADSVAAHGGIDVLVNNAGIYQRKTLMDISDEDWDRVMDVNAKGPFLGTRAVIPVMRRRGGGSIVNISSTAGIRASLSAHYGSSKGAVRLLSKSTAVYHAGDRIRCNSVHPGPIETAMGHAAVPESIRAERLGALPAGRFGTPDEVANAVLFLASDEASFVTGSELIVDGGATAA